MDADANAGLLTTDPAFVDIREGTFYWDMTQPAAMECARLWDALTETVAAAFPSTAWGDYLDEHGATFGLERNPPVAATGQLTFLSSVAALIAAGTQASSVASETGDAVTFQTTAAGTTSAPLPTPGGVTVTPSNTGGSLSAGSRYYHVTAINAFGETTGSADRPRPRPADRLEHDRVDGRARRDRLSGLRLPDAQHDGAARHRNGR